MKSIILGIFEYLEYLIVFIPRTSARLETFASSWQLVVVVWITGSKAQREKAQPTVMTFTSELCTPSAVPASRNDAYEPTSPSKSTPPRQSRVFLISDLDLNEVPTQNST
jgi:hypothetical protein